MDKLLRHLHDSFAPQRILKDSPIHLFTTVKIGGKASVLLEVNDSAELLAALKIADKHRIPFIVLGGCSNILFPDAGFKGLVIKNNSGNIKISGMKGTIKNHNSAIREVFVEVESGVQLNRLVRYTLDEGLEGLENFLGQPGSVGGAMAMNAHNMVKNDFFGKYVFQSYVWSTAGPKIVSQEYFRFAYDYSILQKNREIVLSVALVLRKGDKETLWTKAKEALEYRRKTQPQGVFSSGCIFRNINKSDAMRLATPNFTQSAGYLLEKAGLKGKKFGNVMISTHHANFFINLGGASSQEMIKLINFAKNKVREKFGVVLEEEVVILPKNN